MSYLLVIFTNENETAIIPDNWVNGNEAYWPPYKQSQRLNSAVVKQEVPGDTWKRYPFRVLFTGSWEEARSRLRKSEETSDLQSDEEVMERRPTRTPKRLIDSENEDSDSSLKLQRVTARSPAPTRVTGRQADVLTRSGRQGEAPERIPLLPARSPAPTHVTERQADVLAGSRRQEEAKDVRLFTVLEKILEGVAENKRLIRRLLARKAIDNEAPTAQLPDGCLLPLRTVADVEEFEEAMTSPPALMAVVRYLADRSGLTVKDTVFRILKDVVVTDLALLYNFHGKKGKLSFNNLKLTSIIFKCVQNNPSTRTASRSEVEESIKKWLLGARDREGGRKKRAGLQPGQENEPELPGQENEPELPTVQV